MNQIRQADLASQLGPKSAKWLSSIGIDNRRDLDALGIVEVYALLKAQDLPVSLNLAYALEAIQRQCRSEQLSVKCKRELATAITHRLLPRCGWCQSDTAMRDYHDTEWGVPSHDDQHLYEMLILEGAQAGLSWRTILHKRAGYREAFAGFDPKRVAKFDHRREQLLMKNPEIVRNRLKIAATVTNARALLLVQKEFGTFDRFIWQFVNGKPHLNQWLDWREIPARTPESDAMSKDLKKRGFRFVGTTICYAFMQAVGMVNDHTKHCAFRRLSNKK